MQNHQQHIFKQEALTARKKHNRKHYTVTIFISRPSFLSDHIHPISKTMILRLDATYISLFSFRYLSTAKSLFFLLCFILLLTLPHPLSCRFLFFSISSICAFVQMLEIAVRFRKVMYITFAWTVVALQSVWNKIMYHFFVTNYIRALCVAFRYRCMLKHYFCPMMQLWFPLYYEFWLQQNQRLFKTWLWCVDDTIVCGRISQRQSMGSRSV